MDSSTSDIDKTAPKKWLIIITIMLVAILEVLDSTIVNVSLPHMMPALGANQDQITWVLTSYMVASAMMIPITGFISRRLGHKRLLLINITGFMVSSALCGIAQSLPMMVVFRLFQGGFGAALIPLSQAILRQTFPLEEQGKAMAIWGMGIMTAPAFGPTLGGLITQYASWRWIFYINIPICLLGLLLTKIVIPTAKRFKERIDWLGIFLMFAGIGALQLMLDQGNSKGWFSSNFILVLVVVSIFSITLFLIRCFGSKSPIIRLSIFKNRNFSISTISLGVFAGGLFGLLTLQPIMLETLFGYDAVTAGMTMSPMGIASAIGMIISSQLMTRVNVKYLIAAALFICSMGVFYVSGLNLHATQQDFILANCVQGFGMGLFMVPLATYALATIKKEDITEGAGLFSYGRMLGSSIGISLLATLVTRLTQTNWNQLGTHISIFNNNLRLWLVHQHLTLQQPGALIRLNQTLFHQASMISFLDAYRSIAIVFLLLIPLVLFMKKVSLKS